MLSAASTSSTRPRATRAPYSPCDKALTETLPFLKGIVSLSTSNESETATLAPLGHSDGCSDRPALAVLTAFRICSSDHS